MTSASKIPGVREHRLERTAYWKLMARGVLFFALFTLNGLAVVGATTGDALFSVVPADDPVYGQLRQLIDARLLSPGEMAPPLTRFDVARDILKARARYDEIVVADAHSPVVSSADAAPSSRTSPSVIYKAGVILHNLEETYQYELGKLNESVKALGDSLNDMENQEYALRKRLKGIDQYPTIAIHGLGRAFGFTQQYSGDYSNAYFPNPGMRMTYGYLDLEPEAIVTKEIKFSGIIRAETNFSANPFNAPSHSSLNGEFIQDSPFSVSTSSNFVLSLRRLSLDFNPPWLSATLGDFEESYTPLTLWNRDSLDLKYIPEMWSRQDATLKYESFFDQEPNWPFRGLKVGTHILWPDSDWADQLKLSSFIHMIRNGFDDTGNFGGWYFGPDQFTDWLAAGTASFKTKKWYGDGISFQAQLDTYGTILDEPLYTDAPGSSYSPTNPSTWAHQYLTGSVKPDFKMDFGNGTSVGIEGEYAYTSYQDDKLDPNRVITDYALMGGPYLQLGDSSVSLVYLNVGPYYYNPLAQTRQDAVTDLSSMAKYIPSAEQWQAPLRGQDFLTNVPRPGQIYGFYDRTQDNTFPYGLATPNRQGIGLELNIKALEHQTLKVLGAAYLVQEITGEMALPPAVTTLVPVEVNSGAAPVRNFTYVNIGPSFNLGPSLGWDRVLEIGSNFRYEQTSSSLGTLTSLWAIGGVRVEILPVWEMSAAFSDRQANGTEYGYGGSLYARYTYLYDGSDVGAYKSVQINGTVQSLRWSTSFKVNRNSSLSLDYSWTFGNMLPSGQTQGTLNNQFGEISYEVLF